MSYEALFANPTGRTSRAAFLPALITLLAAAALYFFLVKGRNGEWVLTTLLFPAAVLHARRLHDMGQTGWLLLLPGIPAVSAIWMHLYDRYPGQQSAVAWTAVVLSAGFILWGLLGKGQPRANRFGEPVAA